MLDPPATRAIIRPAMTDQSPPETTPDAPPPPRQIGAEVVRATFPGLPPGPGVYRMLGEDGTLLYVGKARSLRKRVSNYAKPTGLGGRIERMVSQIATIEITTTHTEAEALLLEANLIKRLKPRYNVILRDDKSFPYILIAEDHPYPRITKHRGAKNRRGAYFGPFASAGAVNSTLSALARVFPLRSCSDSDFSNRSRPCLQYQIKRCTAPCVGRIDEPAYRAVVDEAQAFLEGRSQDLARRLQGRMEAASAALDFETAALFRDRIKALAHVTAHQGINVEGLGEADVFALHTEGGEACVQVFFYRGGQNFGNRAYYPAHARDVDAAEVLAAFVTQFYDSRPAPPLLLLSHAIGEDTDLIAEALSIRAGRKVELAVPQRGPKREIVERAVLNAREALARRMSENATQRRLLEGLAEMLGLESTPERIEVYDNSHTMGTQQIGGMIVAGPDGFMKSAYRRFNIKGDIEAGDDYAMMREVLTRRFTRLLREAEESEDADKGDWPDLLLIDGGRGQLKIACDVLAELGIDDVAVAGVSKGPERNAGLEVIHLPGKPAIEPGRKDPVLYFIQRLRDEAHRWAIGGHRARRAAAAKGSAFDEIPGIGAARKKALLLKFGSAKGVAEAGLADLETVEGISTTVARRIYDHFHGGG